MPLSFSIQILILALFGEGKILDEEGKILDGYHDKNYWSLGHVSENFNQLSLESVTHPQMYWNNSTSILCALI